MGLLWTAVGFSIGAAILFASLAIRRPVDVAYLMFASMMLCLAAFLYFNIALYRSATVADAVESVRRQVVAAHVFCACTLVFIPAYTGIRFPRAFFAFFVALLAFFVANLAAPYGLWFSGRPVLVGVDVFGGQYVTTVAPPMSALKYAYLLFLITVLGAALLLTVMLYRRGETQRAITLAIALVVIVISSAVNILSDVLGASWLYIGALGFVAWGLIMSFQLARDFRRNTTTLSFTIRRARALTDQMASIVGALRTLEGSMLDTVTTLEAGISALKEENYASPDLARLQRAVLRLREVSVAMSPSDPNAVP